MALEVMAAHRKNNAGGAKILGLEDMRYYIGVRTTMEKKSLLKKIIRFLFVGLWESTYRRKRQRELHGYHTFTSYPRRDRRVYYSRYRWITKGGREPREKD